MCIYSAHNSPHTQRLTRKLWAWKRRNDSGLSNKRIYNNKKNVFASLCRMNERAGFGTGRQFSHSEFNTSYELDFGTLQLVWSQSWSNMKFTHVMWKLDASSSRARRTDFFDEIIEPLFVVTQVVTGDNGKSGLRVQQTLLGYVFAVQPNKLFLIKISVKNNLISCCICCWSVSQRTTRLREVSYYNLNLQVWHGEWGTPPLTMKTYWMYCTYIERLWLKKWSAWIISKSALHFMKIFSINQFVWAMTSCDRTHRGRWCVQSSATWFHLRDTNPAQHLQLFFYVWPFVHINLPKFISRANCWCQRFRVRTRGPEERTGGDETKDWRPVRDVVKR